MPSKSRKLQPAVTINDGCSSFSEEGDIEFELKKVTGGKGYSKKLVSINDASCILADRRLTSIRQQSDQLLWMDTTNVKIAALPATVFRRTIAEWKY